MIRTIGVWEAKLVKSQTPSISWRASCGICCMLSIKYVYTKKNIYIQYIISFQSLLFFYLTIIIKSSAHFVNEVHLNLINFKNK